MIQIISLNKNQKFTKLINDKDIFLMIKRFTGGKKAASETSKLIADNMSHSPKPSIPKTNLSNSVPSSPVSKEKPIPATKPVSDPSNNKSQVEFSKTFDSTKEKVINAHTSSLITDNENAKPSAYKKTSPENINNSQEKVADISNNSSNNNLKQVTEKKLVIPEGIIKKGETYYNVKSEKKSIQHEISDTMNKEVNFDNILVGVTLNNTNLPEERTPQQKHVNFGSINNQNHAEVFAYATSSAGHSKDKIDHGKPKNLKLSNEKMDGSFVPEYHIERNSVSPSGPDFVSVIVESEKSGGQYLVVTPNITTVKQGDYKISEVGTDYIHNNPEVEKKLYNEYKKVKNSDKTIIDYDPKTKKTDEEID